KLLSCDFSPEKNFGRIWAPYSLLLSSSLSLFSPSLPSLLFPKAPFVGAREGGGLAACERRGATAAAA
ncbi:unnamed protein product, partial [Musa banksii]